MTSIPGASPAQPSTPLGSTVNNHVVRHVNPQVDTSRLSIFLHPGRFKVASPNGQVKTPDVTLATNDNSRSSWIFPFGPIILRANCKTVPNLSLACFGECLIPMASAIILRGTS